MTGAINLELLPALRVALSFGKKTMNKYFNLTDDAKVYQIVTSKLPTLPVITQLMHETVLHLRHKLSYFRLVSWLLEWIKKARKIVREWYEANYAHVDLLLGSTLEVGRTVHAHIHCLLLDC
jgi:hypothetical protein